MAKLYGPGQEALQRRFDTEKLAGRMRDSVVRSSLREMDRKFIASSDMFFLSTIDADGWPTVSYKGGAPGFVKVLDDRTLAFPCYDGNGMFLSMGNIRDRGKVGMLFIDFVHPRRFRLHGTATIAEHDALLPEYPEAQLVARVAIENVFTNCARYVHGYEKKALSAFVPKAGTGVCGFLMPPVRW